MRSLLPILIVAVAAAALAWTWLADGMRQNQFLTTVIVGGSAVILLLLWFAFLTKFSSRLRFGTLLTVVVLGGLLPVLFRVEEVDGDLIPHFVFRWQKKPDELLPKLESRGAAEIGENAEHQATFENPKHWPRFLGPRVDGVVRGIAWNTDWSSSAPERLWRMPIGAGNSSFAAIGDWIVTQEQRGPDELVVCYEIETGNVVWTHSDEVRYDSAIAGVGPRSTPTIFGDRVYAYGATGILNCLDMRDGERVWSKDIITSSNGRNQQWGKSCSPLVHDGLVIVTGGSGSDAHLLAYDAKDGSLRWQSEKTKPSYASPFVAEVAGAEQIVMQAHEVVVAYDPKDGRELWSHDWPGKHPKVMQPLIIGKNRVFVSSGYGVGCELLELTPKGDQLTVSSVWKNRNLKSKFANALEIDGFIYGLDDGIMVCLDLETGKRRWKAARYGHGQLLYLPDARPAPVLVITEERTGDVALVRPNPDGHEEVARLDAIDGRTWNPHAIAGPFLLVRNSTEATCFRVDLASAGNEK